MADKPNIKKLVLDTVNSRWGIRNVDLVLNVMSYVVPAEFEIEDYDTAIEQLLQEGEIIELEVSMPMADYRVKSIYFPKGTRFLNVKEAGKEVTIKYAESSVSNNDQSSSS